MSLMSDYVNETKNEMPLLHACSGEDDFLQALLEWYVKYSQWLEIKILKK